MPRKPKRRGRGYSDPTESSLNYAFAVYKRNAKNAGRTFSLTKAQFKRLTQKPCFYCGAPPGRAIKHSKARAPYVSSGLDRISNNLGYELTNVVPCCTECNGRKSSSSFEEFRSWIARTASHLLTKIPTPQRKNRHAKSKLR